MKEWHRLMLNAALVAIGLGNASYWTAVSATNSWAMPPVTIAFIVSGPIGYLLYALRAILNEEDLPEPPEPQPPTNHPPSR